jgi:hypothetical protein
MLRTVTFGTLRRAWSKSQEIRKMLPNIRLSDLVCKGCGKRGADVRGRFQPARMGTG